MLKCQNNNIKCLEKSNLVALYWVGIFFFLFTYFTEASKLINIRADDLFSAVVKSTTVKMDKGQT